MKETLVNIPGPGVHPCKLAQMTTLFKNEYFTSRAIYKGKTKVKTKANRKDKFTDLVQIYIYFLLDLCIHIFHLLF